jgi:hypothetical protein
LPNFQYQKIILKKKKGKNHALDAHDNNRIFLTS